MINPAMFSGYQLVSDPNMIAYHAIKRTARERWLTWPWQPWVKVRSESRPMLAAFVMGNKLIAHPEVINALRHAMKSTSDEQEPSGESFDAFMGRLREAGDWRP